MSIIGVIEYNWENEKREKQYVLPMFVPGSAEFTNMNVKLLQERPELGWFFDRTAIEPLVGVTELLPPGAAGIGMHVIPVEKAIETENEAISVEKISHWLEKYEGKYAASPCSCRLARETYNEGTGDDVWDWCIAIGDMADYIVETQKGGRYIDKAEALRIFEKAEEQGYVHQITNIDGEDKIFAICNCSPDACFGLRLTGLFNTPNASRSAYVAHVDKKECVACGRCVEYCPNGALKLGQKICTNKGEVEYPKQELPDEVAWGEHKWNLEYRDTNNINTHETGTAPCKSACPAHIAVQGYLKLANEGRYREALELIKYENPFPSVCGHICNRRCEDECTRGNIDIAVAIDEVKKYIAEQDLKSGKPFVPPIKAPKFIGGFDEKIAIIGGGPAGLAAAFYLAESGYKPTVFEKSQKPGGMLVYGIPNFKLEKDIVASEIQVIKDMGVDIKCGVEVGKDITLASLREEGYKAFYLAIGCQGGKIADIPGANAKGVMSAVELLHTVTDNQNYEVSGKTVVIGGGNVAIDAARTSVRCGSTNVSMYFLETKATMPASDEEIEEAEEDGVILNQSWGPKEILTENGKVKGVVFKKCVSTLDENGKFSPVYDENVTTTVECDNVFMSIGQTIEWGNLLSGEEVEIDNAGRPKADKITYQTTQDDIFVGGDVLTGPRFAIDAIATGKQGAISIHKFVRPNASLEIGRKYAREFIQFDKDILVMPDYDSAKRQVPNIDSNIGKNSFKDAKKTFTEEQVKIETSRCLGCGVTIVDENRCIGCGVCTTKCAFDAIKITRDNPECSVMTKSEDQMTAIFPYMSEREIKIKKAEERTKQVD